MSKIVLISLLLILTVYAEIDYTPFVKDLQTKINQKPWKHSAWDRLAYLTDTYGPRMWGSAVLEMAIEEMKNQAIKAGFQNVKL